MRRAVRLLVLLVLLGTSVLVAAPASAQNGTPLTGCWTGHYHGRVALWMYCVPPSWNGDLIIFAHGYTRPDAPLDFQNLTLPDGTFVPDLVQSLGFAFATTSYPRNGLAIVEGVADVEDLARSFPAATGRTANRVLLIGASEGGLVTTLAIEGKSQEFNGGLAACGPIGDFKRQVDYFGDVRVLFDYFFTGVLPPSPVDIPSALMGNWPYYEGLVPGALSADPLATGQLIATGRVPVDVAVPETALLSVRNLLWYNVWATNDAKQQLGGQPYGNRFRWYSGSLNDWQLNRNVQRFSADAKALRAIDKGYQTSGQLSRPLVTLHTTGDEVVPFWHEVLYAGKAIMSGSTARLTPVPIVRYGHCNFQGAELMAAFGLLYYQVTGTPLAGLTLRYDPAQVERDWAHARQMERSQPPQDK